MRGASMGPRHCCRGIQDPANKSAAAFEASMGPRHCCRGIHAGLCGWHALSDASMGPRHCCRGIRCTRRTVAAGTALLQWGRGIAAAESQSDRQIRRRCLWCFNGAAALLPRNHCGFRSPWPLATRFNGAAALLPRNPGSRRRPGIAFAELQWGRGIAAAESRGERRCRGA